MLEHLLRDFRSAALRKQFFAHDVSEYTDTLDVKLLVSQELPGQHARMHSVSYGAAAQPLNGQPVVVPALLT